MRTVAADYRLNPLTVLKGYQQLVDEGLVEKRRGRGMYVSDGARLLLLKGERERFLRRNGRRSSRSSIGWDSPPTSCSHKLPRSRTPRRVPTTRSSAMMSSSPLIEARGLSKRYGSFVALDRADFVVQPGRIVGLIGPNGAGKTTALRAVLGLTTYEGELHVLGREPFAERALLMQEASFIADVAVLPDWLRVQQAIDFVAGVHPRFRRERAVALLAKTDIGTRRRIGQLSKGMKTMVHLALTMAIDARLLVLDEPTLGLDIIARRGFYDALVNDYMDETRTIVITTHQVEEVENLLTDVLFIDKGRIVLDCSVEDIGARYAAVEVADDRIAAAREERPFYERRALGKTLLYFEGADREKLKGLGEVGVPSVADLFVAKVSAERAA